MLSKINVPKSKNIKHYNPKGMIIRFTVSFCLLYVVDSSLCGNATYVIYYFDRKHCKFKKKNKGKFYIYNSILLSIEKH